MALQIITPSRWPHDTPPYRQRTEAQKIADNFAALSGAGVDGSPAGTGVTAEESGGVIQRTVITLANASIPVVSITTGAGIGGLKIYDFPAGAIKIVSAVAALTLSIPEADQADYEATPEGDVGLGSVIITDPTAFSTDATDDDIAAGVEFNMEAAFADAVALAPNAGDVNFATGLDLNLNVFVDAADIDNGVTTTLEATGTVTVVWVNMG